MKAAGEASGARSLLEADPPRAKDTTLDVPARLNVLVATIAACSRAKPEVNSALPRP